MPRHSKYTLHLAGEDTGHICVLDALCGKINAFRAISKNLCGLGTGLDLHAWVNQAQLLVLKNNSQMINNRLVI